MDLLPTAVLARLVPVVAETDWSAIIESGGTAAVIALLGYGIKLLMSGTLRLEREVESERAARLEAEEKAAAATTRATLAESRAEKESLARARVEDEVRTTLRPELLRVSSEATRMVEAGAANAEMMSQLLAALLPKVEKT